jgi:hypothetical protein
VIAVSKMTNPDRTDRQQNSISGIVAPLQVTKSYNATGQHSLQNAHSACKQNPRSEMK